MRIESMGLMYLLHSTWEISSWPAQGKHTGDYFQHIRQSHSQMGSYWPLVGAQTNVFIYRRKKIRCYIKYL